MNYGEYSARFDGNFGKQNSISSASKSTQEEYKVTIHPKKFPIIYGEEKRDEIKKISSPETFNLPNLSNASKNVSSIKREPLVDSINFDPKNPLTYSKLDPVKSPDYKKISELILDAEIDPRNPDRVIVYIPASKLTESTLMNPEARDFDDRWKISNFEDCFNSQVFVSVINDVTDSDGKPILGNVVEDLTRAKELLRIDRDGLSLIKPNSSSIIKELAVLLDMGIRTENGKPVAIVANQYSDVANYSNGQFEDAIRENLKDEYSKLPFEFHYASHETKYNFVKETITRTFDGEPIYRGRGLLLPTADINMQEFADMSDFKFDTPTTKFQVNVSKTGLGEDDYLFWFGAMREKITRFANRYFSII